MKSIYKAMTEKNPYDNGCENVGDVDDGDDGSGDDGDSD